MSLNEYLTPLTGGWCGVRLQEASGLRDGAQVVPDQRETQHPCQGGGAVLEQLQQRRLLHPWSWRGEFFWPVRLCKMHEMKVIFNDWCCVSALQTIVLWIGSQANVFEKQKVREIASLIRDTDRHGKARIVDSSEGEEPEEMLKVNVHFYWIYYENIDYYENVLFCFFQITLRRKKVEVGQIFFRIEDINHVKKNSLPF